MPEVSLPETQAEALTYLTVAQVAKYLNVRESWVYKHHRNGDLKARKFGRLLRFHPDDIEAYVSRPLAS